MQTLQKKERSRKGCSSTKQIPQHRNPHHLYFQSVSLEDLSLIFFSNCRQSTMATSSFLFPAEDPGDRSHPFPGHKRGGAGADGSDHLPSLSSPGGAAVAGGAAGGATGGGVTSIQQIYEGQKFYWRLRLNVDLNFIFYRHEHLIEIISYDNEQCLELNRLYLSSTALMNLFTNDLNMKLIELKKELSKDRFKKLPAESELLAQVGDKLITQFILNRLIAVSESGKNVMKISLLSADTFDLKQILIEKDEMTIQSMAEGETTPPPLISSSSSSAVTAPVMTATGSKLSPSLPAAAMAPSSAQPSPQQIPLTTDSKDSKVKINRRRKTTSGEFDKALTSLRQNSIELNQACDRAAKLTELSSRSVNSFKDALKLHARKYDKTKPLDRFKWAVHRVILNNAVEHVRQQLTQREKFKIPLRINATFPLPDGSIINPANAAAQLQRIPLLTKIHETYSNGPSPFQSPIVTPRGKNPRRTPPPSIAKSSSLADPGMPVLSQRKTSTGKTLMASQSMPLDVPPNQPTSPQHQSPVHLPSLKDKDGKSPNGSSGSGKDKKKTKK